jgi:hypothetical protein
MTEVRVHETNETHSGWGSLWDLDRMRADISGPYASAYNLCALLTAANMVLQMGFAQAVHRSLLVSVWVIPAICFYVLVSRMPDGRTTVLVLVVLEAAIQIARLYREVSGPLAALFGLVEATIAVAFVIALTGAPTKERLAIAAATFVGGAALGCAISLLVWR